MTFKKEDGMSRKRYTAEKIVRMLREAKLNSSPVRARVWQGKSLS